MHVDEINRICFAQVTQVDWNFPAEDRLHRAIRLCEERLGEVQEQYLKMMQGNSGNEDEDVNILMQFTDFFAADLRHVSLLHCVFDAACHRKSVRPLHLNAFFSCTSCSQQTYTSNHLPPPSCFSGASQPRHRLNLIHQSFHFHFRP